MKQEEKKEETKLKNIVLQVQSLKHVLTSTIKK
jgi:hypothetical protein